MSSNDDASDESRRYWMGGDESTVWCFDGHDPKLVQEVPGEEDLYECRVDDCENQFRITVEVEEVKRA